MGVSSSSIREEGYHWVYTIKVGPNGEVDCLKAPLVAKRYTYIYGLNYSDTFFAVAKITTIKLFFAITVIHHWPFQQLDTKNVFLHGNLKNKVYMEQPLGFVA